MTTLFKCYKAEMLKEIFFPPKEILIGEGERNFTPLQISKAFFIL